MNYFELINTTLVELNFKPVLGFSSLSSQEHLRVKSVLNRVNTNICSSNDWNFLYRSSNEYVPKGIFVFRAPQNARVDKVIINNTSLKFIEYTDKIELSSVPYGYFTVFNSDIYVHVSDEDRTATVFYFDRYYAINSAYIPKERLEYETDTSVLPTQLGENALIYGSCILFKANPSHPKYKHWYTEYIRSLTALRCAYSTSRSPRVRIR